MACLNASIASAYSVFSLFCIPIAKNVSAVGCCAYVVHKRTINDRMKVVRIALKTNPVHVNLSVMRFIVSKSDFFLNKKLPFYFPSFTWNIVSQLKV
jgi:hypothetical protein